MPACTKGPSFPAMSPPAMDSTTPTSLHTSVRSPSSPVQRIGFRHALIPNPFLPKSSIRQAQLPKVFK